VDYGLVDEILVARRGLRSVSDLLGGRHAVVNGA
jgi:hypothetical protein